MLSNNRINRIKINSRFAEKVWYNMGMKKENKKSTYQQDLDIDPLDLDEELKWQPSLFMKWNDEYAKASYLYDRSKETLDVLYAQLYDNISAEPEEYGLERYTEQALKAAILQLPAYREAKKRMHKARRSMNILAGAKDAMRQKKDALENLVRIFLSGYYSDPKIPFKAKEAFSQKQDEATTVQLSKSKRIKKLQRKRK